MISNLKDFAKSKGIILPDQQLIADEAASIITSRHSSGGYDIKSHFDELIDETQAEIYNVFLNKQENYGRHLMKEFGSKIVTDGEINRIDDLGDTLGDYFTVFDTFYLGLSQSRKSRAGKSFEVVIKGLIKQLGYPFDEQKVIDGKPDFIMPNYRHFRNNPTDSIILTAKRTLRERWRQIVTEGTRGLGFYLATIDDKMTSSQLHEAHLNRITLVCPERIRALSYSGVVNVMSFSQFFADVLDPAMVRWRRNGIIV